MQVDEEPAIRTNTTILLGNIASHLNEGVSISNFGFYWFIGILNNLVFLFDMLFSNVILSSFFHYGLLGCHKHILLNVPFVSVNWWVHIYNADKEESFDKCIYCSCIAWYFLACPRSRYQNSMIFVCGNSFTSLFMKFLALKIFLRSVNKKIVHFIFHLQFFKCWMLINSNVVVLVSLWTNSKFYCVRDHGSMCHQCLLWRHWDCNSDSTEYRCTYHWSWQVNYSSNDLPIIILAIFLV